MGGPDGQRPAHNEQRLLTLAWPLWPQEVLPCRTTFNQIFLPWTASRGVTTSGRKALESLRTCLSTTSHLLFIHEPKCPPRAVSACPPPPTPLLSPGPQRRDLSPLTRERDILCKLAFFLSQGVFILPSLFLIPDRSYQQKHPRVIDLIQQCKDLPLTPTRGPQKLARGTSQAQRPKFTMSKHGCDHPDSSNRSTGTSNRLLGHLQQTPANHCVLNVFLITPRIESSSRLL